MDIYIIEYSEVDFGVEMLDTDNFYFETKDEAEDYLKEKGYKRVNEFTYKNGSSFIGVIKKLTKK